MMPSAAPQHSAQLEGLLVALSRTLPQAAIQELPVALRRREARRLMMSTTTLLVAARAYAALKGGLALVGLAALAVFVLPIRPDAAVPHLFSQAADPFSENPTVAAGPIQARARAADRKSTRLNS